MKASELIKELEKIIEITGDNEVFLRHDGGDFENYIDTLLCVQTTSEDYVDKIYTLKEGYEVGCKMSEGYVITKELIKAGEGILLIS